MNQSIILEQRRKARAEKNLVDAALVELHVKACDALSNSSAGDGVRERALQQVARWESAHLCDALCRCVEKYSEFAFDFDKTRNVA